MLRTDYKNDAFSGDRKYNMVNNSDGTVSLQDVTEYTVEGDVFGAKDINDTNTRVNELTAQDGLDFKFATDGEGNYGYLGADDSFIPFKSGGGEVKELLWTNPNPTSNFSAQTISLDLSNYKQILIEAKGHKTDSERDGYEPPYQQTIIDVGASGYATLGGYVGSNWGIDGRFVKVTTSGVEIGNARIVQEDVIPLRIYGIKEGIPSAKAYMDLKYSNNDSVGGASFTYTFPKDVEGLAIATFVNNGNIGIKDVTIDKGTLIPISSLINYHSEGLKPAQHICYVKAPANAQIKYSLTSGYYPCFAFIE